MSEDIEFSKEEKEFLQNVAEKNIEPTEAEKALFQYVDNFYYKECGYTHKDGTRVLLRGRVDGEGDLNEDGDFELDSVNTMKEEFLLVRGQNYVHIMHDYDYDYCEDDSDVTSSIKVSIGEFGSDKAASLTFGGAREVDPDYKVGQKTLEALEKKVPDIYDVLNQYIPKGVDIANTFNKVRQSQKKNERIQQEKNNGVLFLNALDKWKNTK